MGISNVRVASSSGTNCLLSMLREPKLRGASLLVKASPKDEQYFLVVALAAPLNAPTLSHRRRRLLTSGWLNQERCLILKAVGRRQGNLRVDGLTYNQIDDEAPPDAKNQLG